MKTLLSSTAHGWRAALVLLATLALRAAPAAAAPAPAAADSAAGTAAVLEINGPIGPATSRYVVHGIEAAHANGSRIVVLELDTPGGLDSAMRDIIRAILASPVPVVSYVTPSGARAASAGTYILYASHVAAMAPATNLGAATPVSIGGEPEPASPPVPTPGTNPPQDGNAKVPGSPAPAGGAAPPGLPGSTMERKVVNDAVAYIRGLAEERGRNADWAEQAVRGAAIWGLLLEGYNPGAVLPGVAGSVCLLIALFAFQILSVNYAGLALVVLGTAMIISEFFFPTYGSLGVGGLIAFVVGSLILFDTDVPGMNVGRPLIGAFATVGGLVIAGIVYLASRSMRRPVATGTQSMIGESAEVVADFTGKGRVRYGGELWNARSDVALHAGDLARIVRVEGLTLWVELR